MNKTLLVASLLALAGASSVAAAADDSWFINGNLGSSKASLDNIGSSGSTTSGGVGGGYYFTPNIGVEGFYNNFGTQNDGFGDSVRLDGWGLGAVAKKDFGPNNTGFFIDGRVGAFFNHTRVNIDGLGSATDNSTKPYFGAGLGWDFNRNFGMSLNYTYTKFDAFGLSGHMNSYTAGIEGRF